MRQHDNSGKEMEKVSGKSNLTLETTSSLSVPQFPHLKKWGSDSVNGGAVLSQWSRTGLMPRFVRSALRLGDKLSLAQVFQW